MRLGDRGRRLGLGCRYLRRRVNHLRRDGFKRRSCHDVGFALLACLIVVAAFFTLFAVGLIRCCALALSRRAFAEGRAASSPPSAAATPACSFSGSR